MIVSTRTRVADQPLYFLGFYSCWRSEVDTNMDQARMMMKL